MAMMSTHHPLMISASGWASTVAGRSSSALKLISQMPSIASGFESSLSRVKCRKQWVSQGVRWETLGLTSSPVAFVSCWTKQCHSERAEGPCEISTALRRQHLSFWLCLQGWGPAPPSESSLSRLSGMQPECWSSLPGALFTSSPDLPLLLQPRGWDSHYRGQKCVCSPSDGGTVSPLWHAAQAVQFSLSPMPPGSPAEGNQAGHPLCTWLWRWGQGHGMWTAALQNHNTVLVPFFIYLQRNIKNT